MHNLLIPTGPAQPRIELLKAINRSPNNYVKARVKHYDAGQEKDLPFHFMVQFDDTIMGSAELARRKLEEVVLPWIVARKRYNGENNGRGYSPEASFSVLNRLDPRLHDGFNLPVVGE
jgi:hypothetical protein